MQRVYISEMLGLSDQAAKILGIVFLMFFVGICAFYLKKKSEGSFKKMLLWLGIGAAAVLCGVLIFRVIPTVRANKLLEEGKYQEAIDIYNRLDLFRKRDEAMVRYADAAVAEGDFELAIAICEDFYFPDGDKVMEVKLAKAKTLLERGELQTAADTVAEILSFPEAARFILENTALQDAVFSPGRGLELPHGEYSSDTWYVAVAEDGKMMLASTAMDETAFASADDVFSWADSFPREDLQEIYEEWFTDEIRDAIILTHNENLASDKGQLLQGEATDDYLFILDADELAIYLRDVVDIFAEEQFWTRTPVDGEADMACLADVSKGEDGSLKVTLYSEQVNYGHTVLAVMWVDTQQLLRGWAD